MTPNAASPSHRSLGMPQDAAGERASALPPPAPLKPAGRDGENFRVPASGDLRKSAVALFTFLRELVSLRTTVVRNVSSYDRVMWLDDVPKDGESDCIAKWEAAQLWVVHNAGYKIQTATNVLIETYNPGQNDTDLAARVTKEPLGGGKYRLIIKAWCNNMFGCSHDPMTAALDFNSKIGATKP